MDDTSFGDNGSNIGVRSDIKSGVGRLYASRGNGYTPHAGHFLEVALLYRNIFARWYIEVNCRRWGSNIERYLVSMRKYRNTVCANFVCNIAVGSYTLSWAQLLGVICIVALTAVNVYGLRRGAIVQDISSWMKFAAIGIFLLLGIFSSKGSWSHFSSAAYVPQSLDLRTLAPALGVALIAVFWGYDSWIYIGWVAGEVKHPQRNIPRSLIISILVVAAVYLLMNVLYVYAMSISEITQHETIARAAAERLFSPAAGVWISAMIALSSFGATSAAILSGARVYYAMAADGLFFRRMGVVHPRWRTPAFSLMIQGIWSAILTLSGRYDQLFTYAIFMGVLASCLTVAGLFILRRKHPEIPRPFRCLGYPIVPAVYVLVSGVWALNTLVERPLEALGGIGIVLLGVPGYLYWKRTSRKAVVP